jgi:DMSO/TMAO reductase YedYZ heme-binding membrane subunit
MVAFASLLLLAVTSTKAGRPPQEELDATPSLVYVAGIAGVIHFIWIQKSDISEPLNWAFWLAVLLGPGSTTP